MQQAGRYQAVMELLEKIFKGDIPADRVINDYMRERKFIGSKDRRFVSDVVWNIIRNKMKLEFDTGSSDIRRWVMLYIGRYTTDKVEDIFSGEKYAPAALSDEEKSWIETENEEPYPAYVEAEVPQWVFEKIKDLEFFKALNAPAAGDFS